MLVSCARRPVKPLDPRWEVVVEELQPLSYVPVQMWVAQASWYSAGRVTADGERFHPDRVSCASRTLPFGTIVEITNFRTHRHLLCRINDRGPYVRGRDIDLSLGAAKKLGFVREGLARVLIRVMK